MREVPDGEWARLSISEKVYRNLYVKLVDVTPVLTFDPNNWQKRFIQLEIFFKNIQISIYSATVLTIFLHPSFHSNFDDICGPPHLHCKVTPKDVFGLLFKICRQFEVIYLSHYLLLFDIN